jgi:hypothetical protein
MEISFHVISYVYLRPVICRYIQNTFYSHSIVRDRIMNRPRAEQPEDQSSIPGIDKDFSLSHSIQTGSGARYTMCSVGFFRVSKMARASIWSLTFINCCKLKNLAVFQLPTYLCGVSAWKDLQVFFVQSENSKQHKNIVTCTGFTRQE